MALAVDVCTAVGHTAWIRRRRDAHHQRMSAQKLNKPFSMIREFHLADWFTLGNAVCGTAAIFSTIGGWPRSEVARKIFKESGAVQLARTCGSANLKLPDTYCIR
jgi:hypothetical protein